MTKHSFREKRCTYILTLQFIKNMVHLISLECKEENNEINLTVFIQMFFVIILLKIITFHLSFPDCIIIIICKVADFCVKIYLILYFHCKFKLLYHA